MTRSLQEGRITRRAALRHLGALPWIGAASCARGASEEPWRRRKPDVPGAERWSRFEERSIRTACGQCPAGCGVRVRVVEGHAVAIEGDPDNPVNRGGIGPRGGASLQVLYDPDRIRGPLRRRGPRGKAESLEPVSWEDAIAELAERLGGLRERGEPHRLGIVCGRERGTLLELWQRFGRAFGTPNFFDGWSRENGALAQATFAMQGTREIPAYDWASTRYVLSLGSGILEASCQSITFARATAHWRRGRPTSRARIVHVEASRSRTAANADEWIRIRPGSDGAFALGLAHVLVRDELYDREFVRAACFGFENWTDEDGRERRGFRDRLLADYSPDAVAAICDVAPSIIERIAREIAADRPSVAITDARGALTTQGLQTAMAVQALNALLGAIERPGGMMMPREAPLTPWPELTPDGVALQGLARPRLDGAGETRFPLATSSLERLPEALEEDPPYTLDTLLLHYFNPLYSGLGTERWRAALAQIPFIVSFSPFADETVTECADLVLPDHTFLERTEDAAPAPATGIAVFSLRRPVVPPLHDTRSSGDVLLDLARSLGGDVERSFPWKSHQKALLSRVDGLRTASSESETVASPRGFLKVLLGKGHWEGPPLRFTDGAPSFPTPSGKFEFHSLHIEQAIGRIATRTGRSAGDLLRSWGLDEDPDLACVPHHRTNLEDPPSPGEIVLEAYKPGTYAEGSGANLPLLQELTTGPGEVPWGSVAGVHPETAGRLGIRPGDRIRVENEGGSFVLPAIVDPGVWPGALRIARGRGHTAFGRYARGNGVNVLALLEPRMDPMAGTPALNGTRVRVRRMES